MKTTRKLPLSKKIVYATQTAIIYALYSFHKALPLDVSSSIGGWVGRVLGPGMKASRYARRNLEMAFPEMPRHEIERIIGEVWNNLGRTVCELPFIASGELSTRATVVGQEHIEYLKRLGKPALFISAHFGNWELLPQIAKENGFPLTLIYRPVNNLKLDKLLLKIREPIYKGMFPKGARGAVNLMRAIAEGNSVAMLVDQKMNSGIEVPFLGRPTMTAPAVAELALKYEIPIVLAYVERLEGKAKFKVTVCKPFFASNTGNRKADVYETMCLINREIENWIRDNPEMWFWVHRRWSKELYL